MLLLPLSFLQEEFAAANFAVQPSAYCLNWAAVRIPVLLALSSSTSGQ
jgi:hypothetical protein